MRLSVESSLSWQACKTLRRFFVENLDTSNVLDAHEIFSRKSWERAWALDLALDQRKQHSGVSDSVAESLRTRNLTKSASYQR